MNKQPRLFPAFVALSLLLASGPLPAAAQMRVQIGAGSGTVIPVVPAIGGSILPNAGSLSNALTPLGLNGALAVPSVAPSPLVSAAPAALTVVTQQAAVAAPAALSAVTQHTAATLAERKPNIGLTLNAAVTPSIEFPALTPNDRPGSDNVPAGRSEGNRRFDGSTNNQGAVPLVDPNFGPYRRLNGSERNKLDITLRHGTGGSSVFSSLNSEFKRQGGYYLLDSDPNARYMASAAVDASRRPVILLTYDLLNRYNGRSEDIYRGAPWEFIASVIAREQALGWYTSIPASAERLAVSFMNMTRVFIDLTNSTSRPRGWATDKDYKAAPTDTSYQQWDWFEQLVAAGRAAASGAGTDTGHLITSKFFSWVRDYTAPQDKAAVPAFQYSLWEQFDGKYYRPGDAKNGSPLPADAPRITDKATYDRAAYAAYGADGKGNAQNGGLDQSTAYGWIIQWLKDRFEI